MVHGRVNGLTARSGQKYTFCPHIDQPDAHGKDMSTIAFSPLVFSTNYVVFRDILPLILEAAMKHCD